MAFRSRDLAVIGYANGWTLWHYASTDTLAAITAPGYFAAAASMLRVGDRIEVVGGARRDHQGVIRRAADFAELAIAAIEPAPRTVILAQAVA